MSDSPAALEAFDASRTELIEAWSGALLALSTDSASDVKLMSDAGLVRVTESLARLERRVQVLQARCAAELSARSRGEDGTDVAKAHGHASAERLIAQATGGRYTDAARLVAVGEATAARASFTGEALPAKHPHLAEAFEAGTISVDSAEVIRRLLDRVAPRADRDDLDEAEILLVERAPIVGVDGTLRLAKQLEAYLDPDGVKPREDELRAARSLKIWQDSAGMINLRGAFDPATGAPIKLAIETLVGAELHAARDAKRGLVGGVPGDGVTSGESGQVVHAAGGTGQAVGGADGSDQVVSDRLGVGALVPDSLTADDRSIAQMNADALADIARLSLSSADAPASLRAVTVIARVDADALASGHGHATIDGIDHPVSVATVRELAMSAGVAPLYMAEGCEKVQLGRAARFFTSAQKAVLVARDGGCAWPGCLRPPSHTQAHHILWWERDEGPTDVDNGIMLCAHHHHRVHDDGWVIQIRGDRSWFIPPPHLDPAQRPRPGNTAPEHLARRRLGAHRPTRSAGRLAARSTQRAA